MKKIYLKAKIRAKHIQIFGTLCANRPKINLSESWMRSILSALPPAKNSERRSHGK